MFHRESDYRNTQYLSTRMARPPERNPFAVFQESSQSVESVDRLDIGDEDQVRHSNVLSSVKHFSILADK